MRRRCGYRLGGDYWRENRRARLVDWWKRPCAIRLGEGTELGLVAGVAGTVGGGEFRELEGAAGGTAEAAGGGGGAVDQALDEWRGERMGGVEQGDALGARDGGLAGSGGNAEEVEEADVNEGGEENEEE